MFDPISWLRALEMDYRARGLLDQGHRFTDADYELVVAVLDGRASESELVLGTRWLRDAALAMGDPIDVLARCGVGSLARWESEDYMEWDVLLSRLSGISRGAFRLDQIELDRHGDAEELVDLDLVAGGVRHQVRFDYRKYGPLEELLTLLNAWISGSGRRFVRIGEHVACVRAT